MSPPPFQPTPPSRPARRLGERLVAEGVVAEEQVRQALEVQGHSKAFLGQVLVELGFVAADRVGADIGRNLGVRYVNLLNYPPDSGAVSLVSESVARALQVLPLRCSSDTVEVAMVDPLDVSAIDRVHQLTGRRVVPVLVMAGDLQRALNERFDARTRIESALDELRLEAAPAAEADRVRPEVASANDAPIVRLVDSIVESALAARASDIHFEPQERGLRVRFRIDGIMAEHADIPRNQTAALVARLKVLCNMDVTETRRPQDGRIRFQIHNRDFDIRVSAVPTVFGEKLVLRILDKASVLVPIANLGFLPDQQERFERLIRRPHGMVLVVGPTGSGKSTTLYASLNLLNDATRNIMTLEDPVEYNVAGLNQVQVNARLGLNFAAGLRTFVRQDPDIILVGEIRDNETAEMAVQAALTGHLLLSTLHTNSAVGTIDRLENLGLDRFLIAQALDGAVSQRLVARVCKHCSEPSAPSPAVLASIGLSPDGTTGYSFRQGRGCTVCRGRGLAGRQAVFEVLELDEPLRSSILQGMPGDQLQQLAEQRGMRSLRGSVLEAVRTGVTTPQEMGRVVLSKAH